MLLLSLPITAILAVVIEAAISIDAAHALIRIDRVIANAAGALLTLLKPLGACSKSLLSLPMPLVPSQVSFRRRCALLLCSMSLLCCLVDHVIDATGAIANVDRVIVDGNLAEAARAYNICD